MNASSRANLYGARFSAIIISLGFVTAVVLYVVLAGGSGASTPDLFGDPFSRNQTAPAADSSRRSPPAAAQEPGETVPAPDPESAVVPLSSAVENVSRGTVLLAPAPSLGSDRAVTQPHREAARGAAAERRWKDALARYDRLVAQRPGDRDLAIERARVLAWSGDHGGAADALRALRPDAYREPEVVLELASFLAWASRQEEADDVLESLGRSNPGHPDIDALRTRVRHGADPSVELAARWVALRDTPLERLLLARALVKAGRGAESLQHYRLALHARPPGDSLALEISAVAEAADSLTAAADVLRKYLRAVPDDSDARLRLARLHHRARKYDQARVEYRAVVAATGRNDIRFELAQMEAWSGNSALASSLLEDVLRENGRHAPARKLLGDIAFWEGDWQLAHAQYVAAVAADPEFEEARVAAATAAEAMAGASVRTSPLRWATAIHGFSDSDGFRLLSSQATHHWTRGAWNLDAAVHQDLWDGRHPDGEVLPGPGHGAELAARGAIARTFTVRGAAGLRRFGAGYDFATWAVELASSDLLGVDGSLAYRREPALHRAATAAALHARTRADILELTTSRSRGAWNLWSRLEVERLGSELGETGRASGVAALRRELGGGWGAFATLGGLTTDAQSPVLAGWGPLYWTPASFASTALGIDSRAQLSPDWQLAARISPGYAWIEEREDAQWRYASGSALTLQSGLEAVYHRGSWQASVAGDWGGALHGYRASALRVGLNYAPARP
jgi:tetratricopeptide (TPR) repeat protein